MAITAFLLTHSTFVSVYTSKIDIITGAFTVSSLVKVSQLNPLGVYI